MKLSTLIAVPLALMAQGYVLVITHSNGTQTKIPTEEVSKMEFQNEETPEPGTLAVPEVTVTKEGPDSYRLNWSRVEGASYYGWTVDNSIKLLTTTGYQCGVSDLTVGDHEVHLKAYPASDSGMKESEAAVVKLTAELVIRTSVTAKGKDSATVSIRVNSKEPCVAGIVPASVTGSADQITYVTGNSAAQRQTFDGAPGRAQSVSFTGLTPNTEYNVVAFLAGATDEAFATYVKTSADLNPGDKASVFPPGVNAQGGWIDVDKVGDLSSYGWTGRDNLMCWACSITGMIQWWLNDYKAKTGHDFETKYPLPAESKCYSTPIMDLYVDYYLHEGGDMFEELKWFFCPVQYNTMNEHGEKRLNESLPYWKGGFAGMTEEEAQSLMVVNEKSSDGYIIPRYDYNARVDAKNGAQENMQIFSERIIDALSQGPVGLFITASSVGSNVHGLSCWGADYEVLSDGTLKVTKLYIGENDPLPGNVKNGMNDAVITYDDDYVKIEMSTTSGKNNITQFFGLRGYQIK